MPRPLPDELMVVLASVAPEVSVSLLARAVGRRESTIRHALQRLRGPEGWSCRLAWTRCTECGGPLAGDPSSRRTVHPWCERARAGRYRRHRRHGETVLPRAPGPVWASRDPAAIAAVRKQEQATARARWERRYPHLSAEERDRRARSSREHAQRQYDETAPYADNWRQPWTDDENRFLLDHPTMTARDAALELGRTNHAIYVQRMRLKRRMQQEQRLRST